MDFGDSIALFCSITAADVDQAKQFLEISNGDLDQAVSLYLDNNPTAPRGNKSDIVDITEDQDDSLSIGADGQVSRIYNSQGFASV